MQQRTPEHLIAMRKQERKTYTAPVVVSSRQKGRTSGLRCRVHVIARDLSRSGIGILAPITFEGASLDGPEKAMRAENVFREGAVLDIGLRKLTGDLLWVYGTVVRVCTVQHEFLDVGVRFNGRRALELDLSQLG